ncbi:hypothetical protein [Actinokineospora pegani]|uniref:hypothetical protein n=1 Tax=Actinokineospora pegani TaxID=2654637 RepID=UPI0012EA4548|nr:hypothetical protein [Actinokineospora pegani]
MRTTLSHRTLSATTIALTVAGIMATTAPTAQATTYTYCSTGSSLQWSSSPTGAQFNTANLLSRPARSQTALLTAIR